MKTPLDLSKELDWKDVLAAYKRLYPEYGFSSVKKAYDSIRQKPRRKHNDQDEFIEIVYSTDILGDHADDYYHVATNKYSLSFRSWSSVCNIPVSEQTLIHRIPAEILAHFLWEITFYGDEKRMRKIGKKLRVSGRELKKAFADQKLKEGK
jgi:hypothetical protein